MQADVAVFEQIRDLVLPLTAEERLLLIQSIATLDSTQSVPATNRDQQRDQLTAEEAAWYVLPLSQKMRYHGQYVAIHNGHVVDSDVDRRALYVRVRQRFSRTPIPILNAVWDEPPVYEFRSPRLER